MPIVAIALQFVNGHCYCSSFFAGRTLVASSGPFKNCIKNAHFAKIVASITFLGCWEFSVKFNQAFPLWSYVFFLFYVLLIALSFCVYQ